MLHILDFNRVCVRECVFVLYTSVCGDKDESKRTSVFLKSKN